MNTDESNPKSALATLAIFATLVLVVVDGAVANLALPTLARTFSISPADSIWVVTGYQMALVMALLPAAALGESRGHRRIFTGGVALFTVASVLCCLAPSLPWLVAARFLQGIGGAAVMGLAVALLRFLYPPERLGRALGWFAMTIALSSAAGPAIGAAILSWANWRWLFAINLPVGLLVLLASRGLPRPAGSARKFDRISAGLNGAVFGPLVLGVDRMAVNPGQGAGLIVLALVALAVLIRRELPQPAPLVPLDLLRRRGFALPVVASVCCFTGQMAGTVALPFYLQQGLGFTAADTGLYMTPWPLAVALTGPLVGRLADRVSSGLLCATGGLCLAAGLLLASIGPLLSLVAGTILCGVGFGLFQTPNNRSMLLAAPRERSGAAGGMQGTARLSGQTAGALVMTLLFALVPAGVAPRWGLTIGAVFALAAAGVSALRIRASSSSSS